MDNLDINIMDSLPNPFCGPYSISVMAYPPSPEPPRRLLPQQPAIAFAQPASSVRVGIVLDKEGQKADRTLLESGYMSDCAVICGNVKWATHKAILCSRNNWFRVALGGPFQEASTGVVTIQDTDPDMVQMILEVIYTGETMRGCSTLAEIVQIWKVADFFGIPELCHQAETAMKRRLDESDMFLGFVPKRKAMKTSGRGCENITVVYDLCGHALRESRACPVRYARPETVFHLCDPEHIIHRESACDRSRCQIRNQGGPANARPGRQPAPPDDATRALIEDEIRMLCRALVLAIAETPSGSCMQKELIRHMCTTRVALWEGFTVCRFLES